MNESLINAAHRAITRAKQSVEVPELGPCLIANTRKNFAAFVRVDGVLKNAARVVWERFNGPIPPDKELCHKCDVPGCVQLSHMFIGTHTENMQDKYSKGRENILRGFDHPRSKLDESKVNELRAMAATGEYSTGQIGRRFGVSTKTARLIINGERFA